ncbi:helix-turn-helix domain-containing protein [Streptomyces sp. NPDC058045]|uniref:helix-turn-helix domain-containing protein n=1 Tax=Streptomyces sp. NPDC058045 TaxID=3346311 RepID=UPI0036E8F70F
MRPRSGPTLEHRVLAERLRALRERADVSLRSAAAALGAHPVTVRRIERAETGLDAGQVHLLLRHYGVGATETDRILARLANANRPGWWHPWREVMEPWQQDVIGMESSAGLVRTWHPALVPELLRTEEYAAAVLAELEPGTTADERRQRVELLAERQRRLAERGATLWALLPEAALHTRVGGPEVTAGQRAALHAAARRPGITLQIVPLTQPPHPLTGLPPLHLLRVPAPEIGDWAILETPGVRVEVFDEPHIVSTYQMRLDEACALAPPPGVLPTVTT